MLVPVLGAGAGAVSWLCCDRVSLLAPVLMSAGCALSRQGVGAVSGAVSWLYALWRQLESAGSSRVVPCCVEQSLSLLCSCSVQNACPRSCEYTYMHACVHTYIHIYLLTH